MTISENEVRIRQLENRLGIVEDRVIGRNGIVSSTLCDERHEGLDDRMDRAERKVTSMDRRLWALLVLALATLVKLWMSG